MGRCMNAQLHHLEREFQQPRAEEWLYLDSWETTSNETRISSLPVSPPTSSDPGQIYPLNAQPDQPSLSRYAEDEILCPFQDPPWPQPCEESSPPAGESYCTEESGGSRLERKSWETDLHTSLDTFLGDDLGGGADISNAGTRHVCRECFKPFKGAYHLDAHAKETRHRAFVCSSAGCPRSYRRRDTLNRHFANAHRKKTEPHDCHLCHQNDHKRSFQRKDHLDQHMRNVHSRIGRYEGELLQHQQRQPQIPLSQDPGNKSSFGPLTLSSRAQVPASTPLEKVTSALNDILGRDNNAVFLLDPAFAPKLAQLVLTQPDKLDADTKASFELCKRGL